MIHAPRNAELDELLEAYASEIEHALETGEVFALRLTANALRNLAETRRSARRSGRTLDLTETGD